VGSYSKETLIYHCGILLIRQEFATLFQANSYISLWDLIEFAVAVLSIGFS
jgi:hypothetical protein